MQSSSSVLCPASTFWHFCFFFCTLFSFNILKALILLLYIMFNLNILKTGTSFFFFHIVSKFNIFKALTLLLLHLPYDVNFETKTKQISLYIVSSFNFLKTVLLCLFLLLHHVQLQHSGDSDTFRACWVILLLVFP